jgi:hypothetical protein
VSLRVSAVGAIISNMICTLRTAANARTTADLPALLQFKVNGVQQLIKPAAQYNGDLAMLYSYNTGAADAANGLDTGVFMPWPEMNAMRGEVSPDAPRDQWLPTEAGTLIEIQGTTWGASAAKLEVLTREVRPGSGGAAPIYAPVIN